MFCYIWTWDCRFHWPQSWNTTLYPSSPQSHFRATSWRKSQRVFYIRFSGELVSFQQSLCRTLQTNLQSGDIAMCFNNALTWDHSTSGGTADRFDKHAPFFMPRVVFCQRCFRVCRSCFFSRPNAPHLEPVQFTRSSTSQTVWQTCGDLKFLSKAFV